MNFTDPGVYLGWAHPLPAWAWVLIVLAALALGLLSYSRLLGPRWARSILAVVRSALVVLLAVLLAGPTLVKPRDKVQPDTLLVLVDRSASMSVADTPGQAGKPALTRDAALRAALKKQAAVFSDSELGKGRHIRWLGFGTRLDPLTASPAAWPSAQEDATRMRSSIAEALARAAGEPISGIVLFSDGRSTQPLDAELAHQLRQRAVGVFAVPLGADPMPLDLVLREVQAPAEAFVNDRVPVNVTVGRLGGQGPIDPARVHVALMNSITKKVLDERTLAGAGLDQPVRLTGSSEAPGEAPWQVRVRYDAPADATAMQRELILSNNIEPLDVRLIDRPIRVLYVDGYPRWTYRYLKNLLVREKSIACSVMLLSADRSFAQEGDVPITRLPRTAKEFQPYDVIILGDVDPGMLSREQIELLRDHVARKGAGLLWIGGSQETPRAWRQTALAPLLPMRQPGAVDRVAQSVGPMRVTPTAVARTLGVLALRAPGAVQGSRGKVRSDGAGAPWPANLPGLLWMQRLGAMKPGVEVLASARAGRPSDPSRPLIARERYGAGQILYVASDDLWRWRYGRGDWYYQQFWIPLLRMLARGRLGTTGQRAHLTISDRRVSVAQTVVVTLRLHDATLTHRALPSVSLRVERAQGSEPRRVAAGTPESVGRVTLMPKAAAGGHGDEAKRDDATRTYEAQWTPTTAGRLVLRLDEPALADLSLSQRLTVVPRRDELQHPQPDHASLAQLAKATGGAVVPLDHLAQLTRLVPNRARKTPDDLRQPIWNSGWALAAVLVLLTGEWVGRKLIRLQ